MRKKYRFVALLFLLLVFTLLGCGSKPSEGGIGRDGYNKKIVSTIFPAYDWAQNVVGNEAGYDIIYLTKSGVDLHSFIPTTKDIVNLATADLVIYVGGPSDMWVMDAIKNKVNPRQQTICLMDFLSDNVVEEEITEGMTEEEEEDEGTEYDEHVWMSLENAKKITEKIADCLMTIDEENKASFAENAENYIEKLTILEAEYEEEAGRRKQDTIIVCDRFPFRYLFDELGLKYYAAFPGCSAESEAGFDTITFLSAKVDELNLDYVCVLEGSQGDISKVVLENAVKKDVKAVTLNSLQSVSFEDFENGVSYISVMKENLDTISLLCGSN